MTDDEFLAMVDDVREYFDELIKDMCTDPAFLDYGLGIIDTVTDEIKLGITYVSKRGSPHSG